MLILLYLFSIPLTFASQASWTWYQSYPECCPDSPNYNASWPKSECDDYSGCKYMGQFACPPYKLTLSQVQSTNLVAFYDNSDPSGSNFAKKYCNKNIKLTGTFNGVTKTFTAEILDTCGNNDCNNCCSKNSQPSGYLVDMEYYTLINNFNNGKPFSSPYTGPGGGTQITWQLVSTELEPEDA